MAYENEDVELIIEDLNDRSEKSLGSLNYELTSLRVGRANAHILDGITVDYYGASTALNQVANITIPEARLLVISVWDISLMKKVEKAIIDANIGIVPTNDGKNIRLAFPEPNEERRKALVKDVRLISEKAKVSIRNIRRDAIEEIKKLKKNSVISEDNQTTIEKDIEKIINQRIIDVDKIALNKENEIMKV